MLGKGLGYCQIPVRELNDLRCLFLKVKLNFAPFAVAICLIQVGCGGDFLFPFLLRFVFQPHQMEKASFNQILRHAPGGCFVGPLRTAGAGTFK